MDGLVLHLFPIRCASLQVRVVDDLAEVVRHLRVQDVEKIFTGWSLAFGINGWEVPQDISIFLHVGPKILDGEFIVMRHRDELHLRLVEQILFAGQHRLQEVFVDDVLWRQIVLYCRGVRQEANQYLRC